MIETLQPATSGDLAQVERWGGLILQRLARYGVESLTQTESDLDVLQRLIDDKVFTPSQIRELECLGIAFGQVLAALTPLEWATVEIEGSRKLALYYPGTTIIVLVGQIVAGRLRENRPVDFRALYEGLVKKLEDIKSDPDLRHDPNWESPVGDPEKIDVIMARKSGGADVILVASRPLDDSGATRRVFTQKLKNYCDYIRSREFAEEFGPPSENRVTLILHSPHEIPQDYINLFGDFCHEQGLPAKLAIKY
jgi:hypothetical protein